MDVKGDGSGLISGAIYISAWRDGGKSLTVSGYIVSGPRFDPDLLNMRPIAKLGKILGKISGSWGEGDTRNGESGHNIITKFVHYREHPVLLDGPAVCRFDERESADT
jgi:hypothetical protein